jgi:5'-methylthioadenosine phosphorylase
VHGGSEAELPYATLAFATDYDCWHEEEADVSVESVLAVLRANASLAQTIISLLPGYLPDPRQSPATSALKHALISHGPHSEPAKRRLAWLLPHLK